MEALINVRQAAELLGLSEKTIRKYVSERRLPHRKIGSRVLFVPAELQAFVDRHKVKALS